MKKFNLEEHKQQFIDVYTNGSIKDVMDIFNLSNWTVNQYAKKLGLRKVLGKPTKRRLVFDDLS